MSATADTPVAGRFSASKPPVFGGRSTASAVSMPGDNPFASRAPIVWRGSVAAATPFSSNSNPFARFSEQANAAGVSGGTVRAIDGSTGSFAATSFGVRQPLPPTASPFGRSAANFGSTVGFAQNPNVGFNANAVSGATIAAPGQATTGWFPLGDISSTPKPARSSPFGAPLVDRSCPVEPMNPFLGSARSRNVVEPSNSFATFRTDNRNAAGDASVSPFAPKAPAPVPTNPFATGNGDGVSASFVQKRAFSTHRSGRTASRATQSATEVSGVDPFGLHSDIAVATPRPFASGWQFTANPQSTLIPNTGIHRSSSLGFRFIPTPVWPLTTEKVVTPQQPKVFSSCFAFPKPASDLTWSGVKPEVAQTPPSFTFKCDSDWNTTPASTAGSAPPTGFDAKLNPEVMPSFEQEPKSLVALPGVNPYGAGSFGAGSLEVAVQAALSFEHAVSERGSNFFLSPKPKPKTSVSYANLGLPTHPINCYQLKASRRLIGERNSLRVASITRAVVVRSARTAVLDAGEQRAPADQSEFTFKSSLIRELDSKKNVEPTLETGDEAKEDTQEDDSVQLEPTLAHSEVGDNYPPTPPVNPACPILSNPQISTVPELSQLQRMSSEDLAQVDGFAVCSAKFGEIEWPGLTDIRSLNLDEILQFSESEIVVYPDECPNKPEVGQGLNKRAILRLSHIYPSETNRKAGVEDEDAATTAFVERLKKRTADLRALFLGYEVEGGVWKFEVKHF